MLTEAKFDNCVKHEECRMEKNIDNLQISNFQEQDDNISHVLRVNIIKDK